MTDGATRRIELMNRLKQENRQLAILSMSVYSNRHVCRIWQMLLLLLK